MKMEIEDILSHDEFDHALALHKEDKRMLHDWLVAKFGHHQAKIALVEYTVMRVCQEKMQ